MVAKPHPDSGQGHLVGTFESIEGTKVQFSGGTETAKLVSVLMLISSVMAPVSGCHIFLSKHRLRTEN